MKILKSKKGIPIPTLYLVTDRKEIKALPIGVPYIVGDLNVEEELIRIMEYEVLFNRAVKSGYPFSFRNILRSNGFTDITSYDVTTTCLETRLNLSGKAGTVEDLDLTDLKSLKDSTGLFKEFMKDSSVYVDVSIIKNLQLFPTWLDKIEEAVSSNIHSFATYDTNMYNKKLEGMYGGLALNPPKRNLIIIDISGSIPRTVSVTCLALAKNLSENFYADLLITGSKSTLYEYENIGDLNVETIYEENGMDNDQSYFRDLLSGEERSYDTAVVFGDNHSPGYPWSNDYNCGNRTISEKEGKKLCKWTVNKLLSFHTHDDSVVAGYADWFEPLEVEKITGWVKDIE